MTKRKLVVSLLTMVLSLFAFIMVSYAWFAVSTNVNNSPLNLTVDPGIIKSYKIHYFTYEHVYHYGNGYDPRINQMEIYNGSTWESPSYPSSDNVGAYDGLLMREYDPLIDVNNDYNNIIIEIYFTYDPSEIDANTSISVVLDSNNVIGNLATELSDPGPYYYYSEVIDIQKTSMINTYKIGNTVGGVTRTDSTNIFDTVSPIFDDTVTYPKSSFASLGSSIDFGDITLSNSPDSGEVYLYFNITYNVTKLQAIIGDPTGFGDLDFVRFYQDIAFILRMN